MQTLVFHGIWKKEKEKIGSNSELLHIQKFLMVYDGYDSIATVGEIRVYWRADFQSGSRVLKKVF